MWQDKSVRRLERFVGHAIEEASQSGVKLECQPGQTNDMGYAERIGTFMESARDMVLNDSDIHVELKKFRDNLTGIGVSWLTARQLSHTFFEQLRALKQGDQTTRRAKMQAQIKVWMNEFFAVFRNDGD